MMHAHSFENMVAFRHEGHGIFLCFSLYDELIMKGMLR